VTGALALVGGAEWTDGCDVDAELLRASGVQDVVVLPTAAAFEQPDVAVEHARAWFSKLGATVTALRVLSRRDALDPAHADAVRVARFIYLSGGSPLHLRSVVKETPLWDALVDAWHAGAVVAGSSAGAMVLGDPMIDRAAARSPSASGSCRAWRSSRTPSPTSPPTTSARSSSPTVASCSRRSRSAPRSCARATARGAPSAT
jgi:cyanophycinase-like exopeptidase